MQELETATNRPLEFRPGRFPASRIPTRDHPLVTTAAHYLVRYGSQGAIEPVQCTAPEHLERGQPIVLTTGRGLELGEVLGPVTRTNLERAALTVRIERPASASDLEAEAQAIASKPGWFAFCDSVFAQTLWPIQVVDIEPLLEPSRAVIYFLGPDILDTKKIAATIQQETGRELVFESVGKPVKAAPGGCGSGGCGSGGCGSSSKGEGSTGKKSGCGSSGGCGGCSLVSKVRKAR